MIKSGVYIIGSNADSTEDKIYLNDNYEIENLSIELDPLVNSRPNSIEVRCYVSNNNFDEHSIPYVDIAFPNANRTNLINGTYKFNLRVELEKILPEGVVLETDRLAVSLRQDDLESLKCRITLSKIDQYYI